MLAWPVDRETLSSCESAALTRNVDLLLRVAPETPLANDRWTAHDVAAHLVSMVGRYLDADRKRADSARDVERINHDEIQEFASATMGELVGRLRARNAKYAAFWPELPLDAIFPLRGGVPLDVACLRTNWISELTIHGRDVAQAVGEPWPLDDTSCLLTLRLLANVLHTYVPAFGQSDYTLTVSPDGGMPFSIVVADDAASIRAGAVEGADKLAGPPAPLVLLFYGRVGLDEAQGDGAWISGDAERVKRFVDSMEKP
ncbi:MAG TPA: maleylpyruvate isomerase N-terminal domain-containing protein [Mycobacteriales bacterium]|nr:maleylpyruvate isomerase N-terminal domain-containing protein [Mycobacteriales bacterium]